MKKKLKETYLSPKVEVEKLTIEQSIAAASVQPGPVNGEYEVQETWQEDTIQEDVNW